MTRLYITHCSLDIRKYGSTFYIGIANDHLALNLYKLKFQFSLSYSIQFDFCQRQSEEHVADNEKKSAISCQTGVILETETNMKICMYRDFSMGMCTMFFYIFINPFTSCITDSYLPQQYIIMKTIKYIPSILSAHGNYGLITHNIRNTIFIYIHV